MSLVMGSCITEWVKRLAGNEIEIGMEIQGSNLGQVTYRWTKGITYEIEWILDIVVQLIKIFVEYVGINMSIQVPLLVIDQRGVSVMSTCSELIGSHI